MPDKSNKFFLFWQELKRRKVIRVVIVYAASAFAILEAADIIFPRLGIPDWSVDLVMYLLAIGFIITVILSWVYDITPEGLKVTESIKIAEKELKDGSLVQAHETKVWKMATYISVLIIVFFVVLRFMEIDKKFNNDITDFRSIAVMPFQNMTNDTLYSIWQSGLQYLLINKLSNSEELSVHESQTMFDILESTGNLNIASISPSIASNLATKLKTNTYIYGSIVKSGDKIRVGAQMRNSVTKEISKSFEIEVNSEDEFFKLTDSLSNLIKNHLEIEIYEQDVEIVLYTPSSSAEAYRYYIQGAEFFWLLEYSSAIPAFTKAIELDPNFHLAYIHLSLAYYNIGLYEQGKQVFAAGFDKIKDKSLLYKEQLAYNALKAWIDKDPNEMIKYTKLLLEINPYVRYNWFTVGLGYSKLWKFREAIEAYEKCLSIDEQWNGNWKWNLIYTKLGTAYHVLGKHKKEKELYELGLSILPDNPLIINNQVICALSRNETKVAERLIGKLTAIYENEGKSKAELYYFLGLDYLFAKKLETSQMYYLKAIEVDSLYAAALNDLAYLLIDNDINFTDAMKYVDRALEIEPDNGPYLDTKGWGLYKLGMYEEAIHFLKLAKEKAFLYNHSYQKHIDKAVQALANQNK